MANLTPLLGAALLDFLFRPRLLVCSAYVRLVDLAALAAVAHFSLSRRGRRAGLRELSRDSFALLLTLAWLAAACSAIFSLDRWVSLKKLLQCTENFFLVAYSAWALGSASRIRYLIAAVYGACMAEALLAAGQFIRNTSDIRMWGAVRISGTLENFLAAYLLLGCAIALSHALHPRTVSWRRHAFGAALLLAMLYFVQVRTIWALAVCMLAALATGLRRPPFGRCAAVLALVIALASGSCLSRRAVSGPEVPSVGTVLKLRGATTFQARLALWEVALRMFRARPLLGVGVGNFGTYFLEPPYTTPVMISVAKGLNLSREIDAHSEFFNNLAELGVLGTLAMLLLIGAAARRAWGLGRAAAQEEPWALALSVVILTACPAYFVYGGMLAGKQFFLFLGALWLAGKPEAASRPDVALVAGSWPPMRCGIGDYSHELARALRETGRSVTVVASPRGWSCARMPSLAFRIARENPRLVHIQYPTIGYGRRLGPQLLLLLLRAAGLRTITTLHEFRATHPLRRAACLPFVYLSDFLIFTNVQEQDAVARLWPGPLRAGFIRRSAVIPVGSNIPAPNGAEPAPNGGAYAAYFGLFYPGKNVELAVEAFAKAAALEPELRFRFIGDIHPDHEGYFDALRLRAERDLPAGRVEWRLGLAPAEVAEALGESRVCVLPFPDGASFKRTSLLAAMTLGVPVVTTQGRSTPARLAEARAVLFGETAEELAARMLEVVRDPSLSRRLSDAERGLSRSFSWDNIARAHIEAYGDTADDQIPQVA